MEANTDASGEGRMGEDWPDKREEFSQEVGRGCPSDLREHDKIRVWAGERVFEGADKLN